MLDDYWLSLRISRLEKKLARRPAETMEAAAQMLRSQPTSSDELLGRIEALFRTGAEKDPDSATKIAAALLCMDTYVPERSWFALLDIVRQSDLDTRLKTIQSILQQGMFPGQSFSDVFNPVHHLAQVYADSMAEDAARTLPYVPDAFMEMQRHNNRCVYPPYSRACYLLSYNLSAFARTSPAAAITAAGELVHRLNKGSERGLNPGTVAGFVNIVRAGLSNEDQNIRNHAARVAADIMIETYDLEVPSYRMGKFYEMVKPLTSDFKAAANNGRISLKDFNPVAMQFFADATRVARHFQELADFADRELTQSVRGFSPDPNGPLRRAIGRIARDFTDFGIGS